MKFIFSCFLCLFLFGCQQTSSKKVIDIPFLPNEASVILRVKDLSKARSLLQNNSLLQQNKTNTLYTFFKELSPLKLLSSAKENYYLCFSPLGKHDFGYSLITEKNSVLTTEINKYITGNKSYNNFSYSEISVDKSTLYVALLGKLWIISSDYLLMENHIKQFQNKIPYKYPKSIESLSDQTISIVFINSEINDCSHRLLPFLPNNHLFKESLNGWTAGELNIEKNNIDFSAIYKPVNNQNDISVIFKNIPPQNNQITKIAPANTLSFTSFTFDDYNELANNISKYRGVTNTESKVNEFLTELTEFGSLQLLKNKFFICRVPNESIELSAYFDIEDTPSSYRDISIYKLKEALNFGSVLQPLHYQNGYQYYFQYQDFIIFATSKEGLMEFIPSLKNENTLQNKEWFQQFSNQLTGQSSMLMYAKSTFANLETGNVITKDLQKEWAKNSFKKYDAFAFQVVAENNFSHLHLVTTKTQKKSVDFKVSETANLILETNLKSSPKWVTNYISETKDLLVQDDKNTLLLISNEGDIKWKKELNEPILGEVKQMDIYRNRRLQYVFATPTQLHVLDRKGKNVAPYPITFKKIITQPVSLFDYDNNRKYRIVITQGSELVMLDVKGKRVKGFRFKNKTNGTITHSPKHIRVGKKDYIIVNESNGGVHFLNRTGKERIKLKEIPPKTTKEWYWYNNSFTTLNVQNTLSQFKTNGILKLLPSPLNSTEQDTFIDATSKTWVSFSGNSLSIKGKTIELEYGTYSNPKIFYIKNKIYVTITNIDSKKVYLFDSNTKSIKGFPVYGTSQATIDNADKDAYLELAVKGDQNSILFYEFK